MQRLGIIRACDPPPPLPVRFAVALNIRAVLTLIHHGMWLIKPVAPVAYQVILEPGIGQFREFEPCRVHTRINSSWDLFLCTN